MERLGGIDIGLPISDSRPKMNGCLALGGSRSNDRVTIDCHRENEAVVVISMLADHIHPAWRGGNPARLPVIGFGELFRDVVTEFG
jgi:hypothetical protein